MNNKELYSDLIGKPYIDGERNCWTFVKEAAERVGIFLPDYSVPDNHEELTSLINSEKHAYKKINKPEPHCLVLFRIPYPRKRLGWHVGFMIDNTHFIHCTRRNGVNITSINNPLYFLLREGFYKCKS